MRSIILLLIVLFVVGSLFASTAYTDWLYEELYGEQEVKEVTTPPAPALNGYIYIVPTGCSCGCSC